jgi:hypothetical protein
MTAIPDGVVAVVKSDCPTCQLVAPVLTQLRDAGLPLTVFSQDGPEFAGLAGVVADDDLSVSWSLDLDTVPTLIRMEAGREVDRTVGWMRVKWEALTGVDNLGTDLPEMRPGCGSVTVDPAVSERLVERFGSPLLRARRIELADSEDDAEACYERGWTDGLPVVPPTPGRVLRMLDGTTRSPSEVVGMVAPAGAACTVEQVAINAVMAGCRPEYMPVVLAIVEAACTKEFNLHGVLCTTYFAAPVIVVNGPVTRTLGMNSGINVLGQGNRANASIGRTLQLIVRNIGRGLPGEIDRATFGHPGKYTCCFPENEDGSPWEPLAVARGVPAGRSAVTLFAGEAPRAAVDEHSRSPESLSRSLAMALRAVGHPRKLRNLDVLVAVSPQHMGVFREAGWTRERVRDELVELLTVDVESVRPGVDWCEQGDPDLPASGRVRKFDPDQILLVHAGGGAGPTSAVFGGWLRGDRGGSYPVTVEVRS